MAVLLGLTAVTGTRTTAQSATPLAHRFIKVADDVYAAVGNGTIQTQDTVAVIVNRDDVLLVDTNITPEATRRLVNDIKTLTDKPLRYVVNTHWHYDHTDGNQVFGPDVRIIGHENTRKAILGGVLHKRLEQAFRDLPNALANTRKRLDAEQNPAAKEKMQQPLAVQEAYQAQLKETVPRPPNAGEGTARTESARRRRRQTHRSHRAQGTLRQLREARNSRSYCSALVRFWTGNRSGSRLRHVVMTDHPQSSSRTYRSLSLRRLDRMNPT